MPQPISLPTSHPNNDDAHLRTARSRADTTYTLLPTPAKPPKWMTIPVKERWLLIGFGSFLALIGGYINGTTIFGDFGTPVSHTTGSSTNLGIALVEGRGSSIALYASLVLSFTLGGVVSGAIVGDQGFRWSRRYGWVLMLEALFLVAAYLDMHTAWDAGEHENKGRGALWAAFACGLQNAITTTFSGAVIRTTHTTGLLTDIGVVIGQMLFHREQGRAHLWKLSVFGPLYVSFVLGGCVAVLSHWAHGDETGLLVVAGVLFVTGTAHSLYRAWWAKVQSRARAREWEDQHGTGYENRYRDDEEVQQQ